MAHASVLWGPRILLGGKEQDWPGGGLVRVSPVMPTTPTGAPTAVPKPSKRLVLFEFSWQPCGGVLQMKKLRLGKFKYLGPKHRPRIQAEFPLVANPSFGILDSHRVRGGRWKGDPQRQPRGGQ